MTDSLFEHSDARVYQPLAARMRPRNLDEFVGQQHLLAPGKSLYEAITHQQPHSMIFWGPPGVGKTTLARLLAEHCACRFEALSAVLAGIRDIRETIERARYEQGRSGRKTLLFVDEVHRFNKAQQDAFLPHVEEGTVFFIGATTENPSFELNNALLSRARVYLLQALQASDLERVIDRALEDCERGLGKSKLTISGQQRQWLARAADGDARRCLNTLELLADLATGSGGEMRVEDSAIEQVLQESYRRFDKGGDSFYDQISALHKAVRGSSPDAALYWLARMLDGGCDPVYIARRLTRMATEDIGLADPRALQMCLNGWDAYVRLGSPEGDLALAEAAVYLACAPKSNALYLGMGNALQAVSQHGSLEVPLHLRNAPTELSRQLGHGAEYRYAHDEEQDFAAGESYLPEKIHRQTFYKPTANGLEGRIKEKLEHLRKLDQAAARRRYEE